VLAGAGKVTLDLPADAVDLKLPAFNEQAQYAEGIDSIGGKGLRYTKALADSLRRARSRFPEGFSWRQIEEAASDMLCVRTRLGGTAP